MDTNSGNNQYDPNYQNNQSYPNSPNNQGSQNNTNNTYQNDPNAMYANSQYNGYQNPMTNYPYQTPTGNNGSTQANGLQIAGLVCGILAICFSCCSGIPGIILGIVGIICAINGNKESKNGMGTAGLVCSIVGLILGMLMFIYFVVVYIAAFDEILDIGNGYTFY